MARGRPPTGPQLVDALEGSAEARARLEVILETIAGRRSIPEACSKLGIGEAAFHKMRRKALLAALDGLEPGRVGRPPASASPDDAAVRELRREVAELRLELQAARIKEEIAIAMPHLSKPPEEEKSKKKRGRSRRRRRRR